MFVVSVVNVLPKTEDDIIRDCQYDFPMHCLDKYKEWLKSWDMFNYKHECEQVGYKAYDYAMIYQIPMNCMYPDTEEDNLHVFKFNKDTGNFEEVKDGFNDEVSLIFKKHGFTVM